MNSVVLIGRLTKKPEVRSTQSQTAVVKFTLAVDRPFAKDKKEADFISIVAFGKQAENCGKYLDKGRQIAVEGRIQTGKYEKDGQTKYTFDVVAERVKFLGSNPAATNKEADIPEGFELLDDNDMPF